MALEINGSVSPGYESVRTLFASHLARNAENQAQLCVYVKGIKVVDLWGSSEHGRKACKHRVYHADSLQIVFSSGTSFHLGFPWSWHHRRRKLAFHNWLHLPTFLFQEKP